MTPAAPGAEAPSRPGDAVAPKYWAFISYSHADERWARWLHRALESYAVPARLVGTSTRAGVVPRRLFPIFRDRDELAGAPELGPELHAALKSSRALVVVCSPHSARSQWVDDEIRYYKSLSPDARVFALIVDGEPNGGADDCFPKALRVQVDAAGRLTDTPAEPIAADARPHADGKDNARLKLIAGLLGVRYDDLRQRDLQARNRRLAVATALASGVALSTAGLAVLAWNARNDALRRQQQAEDLLQFMLGDLRDKLEPIGKLAILDAVGTKAMDYFATLSRSDETDAALTSRATALRQIGEVRVKQGNLDGASAAFQDSLRLSQQLARRHPDDLAVLETVAKAQFSIGLTSYLRKDWNAARPWLQAHLAGIEDLQRRAPRDPHWVQMAIEARTNLGALEFAAGDYAAAGSAFERALASQQGLTAMESPPPGALETLAALHGWLASVADARGDDGRALAHATAGSEALRAASARQPDDARLQQRLAEANLRALHAETQVRPLTPDSARLAETLALTRELTARDPQNQEYAHAHCAALRYAVDASIFAGHTAEARAAAEQLVEHSRGAFKRAPTSGPALDDLVAALALAAKLEWLGHDRSGALARVQEALGLAVSPEQSKAVAAARWVDLHLLEGTLTRDPVAVRASVERASPFLEQVRAAGEPPAELMLRYETLRGDVEAARHWSQRLSAQPDPFVSAFCAAFRSCAAAPKS